MVKKRKEKKKRPPPQTAHQKNGKGDRGMRKGRKSGCVFLRKAILITNMYREGKRRAICKTSQRV